LAAVREKSGQGRTIAEVCKQFGISPATYHRWKKQRSHQEPVSMADVKQLKKENAELKRIVAEQQLRINALVKTVKERSRRL
jgi:putative transposase